MKRFNINVSTSQPNFSVVIPVINPYFINTNPNNPQIELNNIDWSKTCPEFPKLEAPSYPNIDELPQIEEAKDDSSIQKANEIKQRIQQIKPYSSLPSIEPSNSILSNDDKIVVDNATESTNESKNETEIVPDEIMNINLLQMCEEEMRACAKTIKRIRESNDDERNKRLKLEILKVIHSHILIVNNILDEQKQNTNENKSKE